MIVIAVGAVGAAAGAAHNRHLLARPPWVQQELRERHHHLEAHSDRGRAAIAGRMQHAAGWPCLL